MNKEYLVFVDNRQFDQGSLDAHLEYLKMYDGTPDMLEAFEYLESAIFEADLQSRKEACRAIVYSWYEEKIVKEFIHSSNSPC